MALAQQVQLQREPGGRTDFARRVTGSPALQLVGRRLLTAIPVLLGVTFLTFVVMNLIPGNPAQLILGINASPSAIAKLDHQLGLDHPFWDRYWIWLDGLLHGNLGTAYSNQQSVNTDIAQFLPTSCTCCSTRWWGRSCSASRPRWPPPASPTASSTGSASRSPCSGCRWRPTRSRSCSSTSSRSGSAGSRRSPTPWATTRSSGLRALTLPAVAIGFPLYAVYTRLLRADIVEQMQREDYIVTAKAKGVPPWRVLIVHATRNSLFTLITLVALNLGTLIGALAIIEPIFSLPGIGAELINAININDLPLVEGIVVVFALITVAGNLIADLLYTVLDPRIRYGRAAS